MARTLDREARRAEIVSAATAAFAERGIAHTAVSDIVKAQTSGSRDQLTVEVYASASR